MTCSTGADGAAEGSTVAPRPHRWPEGITRTVVVLGVVALFTDTSSEMIVPFRLIFLVQVLGTPFLLAGLIEGLAEGATSLLKLASGRLSDRCPSRKGLVAAGYSISNLSKPLLALVTTWPLALGLVLVDRAGKAVRGSPRDAMIADAVEPAQRGKAFGFYRGADTLGAAQGPLLAAGILVASSGNLRAVFAWTFLPAALAIICVTSLLRDPRVQARAPASPLPARGQATPAAPSALDAGVRKPAQRGLGPRFWLFTAIATCFALGNSSDAFLFLRTEGLESSLVAVPLLYCVFNLIYAVLATPLGSLSDRFGRLPVLAAGYAAFTLVYLGWTQAHAPWNAWALFAVYGVYYAATDGVAKAFVTDLVPRERRGTAMGWFQGLTGAAALPANMAGAWLWSRLGPGATFGLGAWLGAVSLSLLFAWWPALRKDSLPRAIA